MIYTPFTESEYYDRTGEQVLAAFGDPKKAEIAIAEACDDVIEYIEGNDPSFDREDITEAENTTINRAAILQLQYRIANGNFKLMSGMDAIGGSMTPTKEITERILAPSVKRYLESRVIVRVF